MEYPPTKTISFVVYLILLQRPLVSSLTHILNSYRLIHVPHLADYFCLSLSVRLSVSLSPYFSVSASLYLSISCLPLSPSLSLPLSLSQSFSLPLCLSLSLCLSVSLSLPISLCLSLCVCLTLSLSPFTSSFPYFYHVFFSSKLVLTLFHTSVSLDLLLAVWFRHFFQHP